MANVLPFAPKRVAQRLLFCSLACLGCPQLLEDDFGLSAFTQLPDGGTDVCSELECVERGGAGPAMSLGGAGGGSGSGAVVGLGGAESSGGAGGEQAGAGAGGHAEGGSGSAGSAGGDAGDGGSSSGVGGADTTGGSSAGGSGGTSGAATPECWVLELNDDRHSAADNCLGIHGWNALEADPQSSTSISVSYSDGDVCFEGTVDNQGWGAVYNLTLADTSAWDATDLGITGFEFGVSGALLPPRVQLTYSVGSSDYCRVITPSGTLAVPFSSAHPQCSTSPTAGTPNPAALTFIRWSFSPLATDYGVDFCLTITALQ